MPEELAALVGVVSLNTRGVPVTKSRLAERYAAIGPATFRAEYLPAGETPHCIDFILVSDGVKAESATVVFADKEPLPGGPGYVSDHLGLRASLFLASS